MLPNVPSRIAVIDAADGQLDAVIDAVREQLDDKELTVTSWQALSRRLREPGPSCDLVLVDLDIGDGRKTGRELIPKIRAVAPDLLIAAVASEGDVDSAREAIELGANDFFVRRDHLGERVTTLLRKFDLPARLIVDNRSLRRRASELERAENERFRIIGESAEIREVIRRAERIANVPRPVLIIGERGTGKELVARAIHHASGPNRPFVAVNCAALADTLLESELFGHEKGAFSGAVARTDGKFAQASGGTLFLDEIGNMSLAFQQKILRVVEYGVFTRVGGRDEMTANVRIIGATNIDLEARIEQGRFLPDLYDRLAFEVIRVPPLRERGGEIEVLAGYFLEQFMREVPSFQGKRLSRDAIDVLHRYPFPGNIRELKNIIERAVYRDTTNELLPEDLGLVTGEPGARDGSFKSKVRSYERQLLSDALTRAGGNRAEAARRLDMPYHQFRHYCRKHRL
jgi:DNA-binding NtrC family response regulator